MPVERTVKTCNVAYIRRVSIPAVRFFPHREEKKRERNGKLTSAQTSLMDRQEIFRPAVTAA